MWVGESFCALVPPSPSPFSGDNSGDKHSVFTSIHFRRCARICRRRRWTCHTTPRPPLAASAGAAADEEKQNLNGVINSIQKSLGLLHQLHLTVSSFSVSSQLPLLQRLNALVSELDNMQCSLIDEGKNPDEYTRDVINSCISRNQITKGKTDAFKGLRKHLLEELEEAFPDEVESYRAIRASSATESKRLTLSQGVLPNGDAKVKTEH